MKTYGDYLVDKTFSSLDCCSPERSTKLISNPYTRSYLVKIFPCTRSSVANSASGANTKIGSTSKAFASSSTKEKNSGIVISLSNMHSFFSFLICKDEKSYFLPIGNHLLSLSIRQQVYISCLIYIRSYISLMIELTYKLLPHHLSNYLVLVAQSAIFSQCTHN